MCSPDIMAKVRASISRRQVLGAMGGAVALGLGGRPSRAAAQEATPVVPAPSPLPGPQAITFAGFTNVQDLTHVVSPSFPMFPGAQQMQINVLVTIAANGFYKNELILDEHTGTHMDAPAHFIEGAASAEQLPANRLIAPLAVVHIHERAAGDPDAQVTPDDILAWEAQNGPLPPGALVAMHSGWEARVGDPTQFLNVDASGVPHFPGFHPDAAALLVNERDIVGIGVDTVSLDFGATTDFASHITALGAGKYGLENLANLALVPPAGAFIVVGGPKHLNASGGPTRALALF